MFYGDVFTFIDTFTRESYISIQDVIKSLHGKQALQDAIKYFKQIEILQNDGEFKGYYLEHIKELKHKGIIK